MSERNKNWTEDQKQYLLECIEEEIKIIEDKRCDSNAMKLKQGAWGRVCSSFAVKLEKTDT